MTRTSVPHVSTTEMRALPTLPAHACISIPPPAWKHHYPGNTTIQHQIVHATMAIAPGRMVQTSTEAKKKYKNGVVALPARQLKQLERGLELDERAARYRELEEKRKAAKKRREEREAKEAHARQEIGIGLATQMIGYSHTQAQLKNGMEAFLGLKKRRDQEKRKKDMELNKKLEKIALALEEEPRDDDDDHKADNIAFDVAKAPDSFEKHFHDEDIDDDIDDDSLLQAHDLVMSDPIEETPIAAQPPPEPVPPIAPILPPHSTTKNASNCTQFHGPINKVVENILNKLPGELVELLSQDISMKYPEWDPPPGLLHKLNPIGLPPHRLRIKIGCIVTVLQDLNNSSQLSKSQHLQVLRAENERLECLVLDGQLEGTRTILTRIPFLAKYRNQDQYPFRRTQFPVRVSIDYTCATLPQDTAQSGFKIPAILSRTRVSSVPGMLSRDTEEIRQVDRNPGFKVPGIPASKLSSSTLEAHRPIPRSVASLPEHFLDGWDDFLDSGSQIARELSEEPLQPVTRSFSAPMVDPLVKADLIPPISTQDLSFCMDDLDNDRASLGPPAQPKSTATDTTKKTSKPKAQKPGISAIDLSNLRPSQKPRSVSDRPGLKRKVFPRPAPPPKRRSAPTSRPVLPTKSEESTKSCMIDKEFLMSTQDVASFFDDEDDDLH